MSKMDVDCLLKISNLGNFTKFLHECVDELIGVTTENNTSYSSDVECTKQELQKARIFVKNIFIENASNDQLCEDFKGLNMKEMNEINICYEIRKNDIISALVKDHICMFEEPLVENIDWKLKWIMGSSKLATINEPVLQIDLHCSDKKCGRITKNFEVNLDQLDKFIKELESSKSQLVIDSSLLN